MEQKVFSQEIHHRAIRKFRKRKVVVNRVDEIWGMDLASMESFADSNDGYKFILCIIDVFSKFAWCVPLKSKTASSVLNAVKAVVKESKREPEKIWVDKGTEFYNKDFKGWAKSQNIIIYSTYGESKSVVAERFIRTIKELIFQKFSESSSRAWVKMLPSIVKYYNRKYHKSIKMSPIDASDPANELQVYHNLYPEKEIKSKKKAAFKVGDQVRVSRIKEQFEKGYEPRFSYEVFTVAEVLPTSPITYKLKDYDGDMIEGSWYEQELLKSKVPDYYLVEKVLRTRTVGKKKESLVKFLGWPKKFNQWIADDKITEV